MFNLSMTNMLRVIIASILCSISLFSVAAPNINTRFSERIIKSLNSNKVEPDALSLVAIPLTGKGTASYVNADIPVNPASTMKLFTTYAALELLGPNFRWRTAFFTDKNAEIKDGVLHGNLYFKGGGDPKLNMERLWMLLRELKNNGITTITGNLVLDHSYFKLPKQKPFLDDSTEPYRPYLVSPDSLLINLKVIRIITRSDNSKSEIIIEPPLKDIEVINHVKMVDSKVKGRCPTLPDIEYNPIPRQDGKIQLVVSGTLVKDCTVQKNISLLDHDKYAINIIRSFWQEVLGGEIKGKNLIDNMPKDAKPIAVAWSPDLVEVIRDINKFSNNTMAKQLFLTIGAKNRQATDIDDASAAYRAIYEWLIRKGVDPAQLKMENGSGLSRDERITAREMADLLKMAWNSPYSAEFISSMPIIGMDGTMYKRLKNTPLKGKGHIKTGTLNNVRAIAGYIRDKDNDMWAVVAILNHPRPWGAREVLDDVLLDLYNSTPRQFHK